MTCFWDGILSKIAVDDIDECLGLSFCYISIQKDEFIKLIQKVMAKVKIEDIQKRVAWNGEKMSTKIIEEHKIWIKDYNVTKIYQGHDCSICDPFLVSICYMFKVDIIHRYNNNIIKYKNLIRTRRTIDFSSDTGHFWAL